MAKVIEVLKRWKRILWKALSGDEKVSWVAHFFLTFLTTLFVFAVVEALWAHKPAILIGFILSEAWLLFMGGREVRDYIRKMGLGTPKKDTVRDGLGDIIGPLLNHLIWWAALASILGG